MQNPIIIIGTGLAGYNLAREFRKLDQESPLMLVTQDDGCYYSKPQLSAAFTNGKTPDDLPMSDVNTMREQLNAEILTYTEVTSINPEQHVIHNEDKTHDYSKLVLACGANVLNAKFAGNAANEVYHVNNLEDYRRFYEALNGKKTVTLIGAGLIGTEFACDLTKAGFNVNVVALSEQPLDLFIPSNIGKLVKEALAHDGVNWHLQQSVASIDKSGDKTLVSLSSGEVVESDIVLSAIGIRPNLQFANNINLNTNKGIVVNRLLETNLPDIYALGDCAEVNGHVLPYTMPLFNCARALAKTLSGTATEVSYPAMPVIVKSPLHPVVFLLPQATVTGNWQEEISDSGAKALFYDNNQQLHGFVLTGDKIKERATYLKEANGLF